MWIALGVVILGGMLVVGLMAGAAFFGYQVYQQVNPRSEVASPADAEAQFKAIRARFSGRKPLLEFASGETPTVNRALLQPGKAAPISQLQVVAYDPRDKKLFRMSLPMWALRLIPEKGELKLGDGNEVPIEHLNVTAADLDAFGPGLVLDHQSPAGEFVLVWTE